MFLILVHPWKYKTIPQYFQFVSWRLEGTNCMPQWQQQSKATWDKMVSQLQNRPKEPRCSKETEGAATTRAHPLQESVKENVICFTLTIPFLLANKTNWQNKSLLKLSLTFFSWVKLMYSRKGGASYQLFRWYCKYMIPCFKLLLFCSNSCRCYAIVVLRLKQMVIHSRSDRRPDAEL